MEDPLRLALLDTSPAGAGEEKDRRLTPALSPEGSGRKTGGMNELNCGALDGAGCMEIWT